ncbi:hypothetical protein [Actinacidiphila bryophytorum]|nr:hypothetical protein [Actinacidiphila bryophytorum]
MTKDTIVAADMKMDTKKAPHMPWEAFSPCEVRRQGLEPRTR